MDKGSITSITDISETLLIPLYARAQETLSKNPVINDRKAVEITEKLNIIFVTSNLPLHQQLVKGKIRRTANKKLTAFLSLRTKNLIHTVLISSNLIQMELLWNLDVV
jgi:O-methyltransferase involved in polyketide biosynthesis